MNKDEWGSFKLRSCEIDWRKAPWNSMDYRKFDGKRFVAYGAVTSKHNANMYAESIREDGGLARIVKVASGRLQVWGHPNGDCRAYARLLDATPFSKRGYVKGGVYNG